jgi:hypothetical protein
MNRSVPFVVGSGFWKNCHFLDTIIVRACRIVTDSSFFDTALIPLVKKVLRVTCVNSDKEVEMMDEDIKSFLFPFYIKKRLVVIIGGCDSITDLTQAENFSVFIQGGRVAQAVYDYEQRKINYEGEAIYRTHLALGIIKLLNEFAHCMTDDILRYVCEVEKRTVPSAVSRSSAPVECGGGSMGSTLEEVLTGGYKIFGELSQTGCPIPFQFVTLSCSRFILGMKEEKRMKIMNYEEFISSVIENESGLSNCLCLFKIVSRSAKNKRKRSKSRNQDEEESDSSVPGPGEFSEKYGILSGAFVSKRSPAKTGRRKW